MSTPPRSEGRRRSTSVGRSQPGGGGGAATPTERPRFITPGRSRKSAFAAKGRSSSFGGGGGLRFASPERSRGRGGGAVGHVRPHRMPLSKARLEAASNAIGLATALGYAPPALDPNREAPVRAVFQAAELLYSRHALGLRWSKGALAVAKAAAAANAAEMATASAAAAAAVAAKRKGKSRGKSKKGGGGSKGKGGSGGAGGSRGAEISWEWGSNGIGTTDRAADGGSRDAGAGDGGGRLSPRLISTNGELRDVEQAGGGRGRQGAPKGAAANKAAPAAPAKSKIEIRMVASPRVRSSGGSTPRKVPPSPGPVPMGRGRSKKAQAGKLHQEKNGGAAGGREGGGSSAETGGGGEAADGGSKAAEEDAVVAWTWGGGGGAGGATEKDVSKTKTPLPSDLRQLSRWRFCSSFFLSFCAKKRSASLFFGVVFEGRENQARSAVLYFSLCPSCARLSGFHAPGM